MYVQEAGIGKTLQVFTYTIPTTCAHLLLNSRRSAVPGEDAVFFPPQ